MPVLFRFPNKTSPTTTLTFNAASVSVTRKRPRPIQQIQRAVSGRLYRRQLSANVEETWEVDFSDLAEADAGGESGFTSLNTFIRSTLGFHQSTFELTDADGDSLIVLYVGGLPSMEESGGPTRLRGRSGYFSGTLIFEKSL